MTFSIKQLTMVVLLGMTSITVNATTATDALKSADAVIQFHSTKLESDPHSFLDARSLGFAYANRGRLTGAMIDYKQAEAAFAKSLGIQIKGNTVAAVGLASALQAQHRFRDAQSVINGIADEAETVPTILAVAGDVAFELGAYETASAYYTRYAAINPGAASWSRIAKFELLNGHWDAANVLWGKICALPTGSDVEPSAWGWVMYGDLFLRAGRIAEARECFSKSLTIMPGYCLGLEHMAETYELEHNDVKAELLLKEAINRSSHADLLLRLAKLKEANGKSEESVRLRDSAFALLEGEFSAGDVGHRRVLIAAILDHGGSVAQVLTLAQAELADRGDIGAEMAMARALHANGRYTDAASFAHKALRFNSYEPQMFVDAARIFAAAGDMAGSLAAMGTAEELNPTLTLLATNSK